MDRDYINEKVKTTGTNDEDILQLEFGKIYKTGVFVPPECTYKDSSFFIQYSCTQPQSQLNSKYKEVSTIACLGVFVSLFYLVVLYFFKRNSKIQYKSWDMNTITPGDYSVEMEITHDQYRWFLDNIYPRDKAQGISPGMSLKTYLKKELETILDKDLQKIRTDGSESQRSQIKIQKVKIADIVFAFNNSELIHLLRERGYYVNN